MPITGGVFTRAGTRIDGAQRAEEAPPGRMIGTEM